jgi:hypothetical protein
MNDLESRERASIRDFVARSLENTPPGRLLDYGCGKQPYRLIAETNGHSYHGWDRANFGPYSTWAEEDYGDENYWQQQWDIVLLTQVIQYVDDPLELLRRFRYPLIGDLILTFPTSWPTLYKEDRWRFTESGMAFLLDTAGFYIVESVRRDSFVVDDLIFATGYGVHARPL